MSSEHARNERTDSRRRLWIAWLARCLRKLERTKSYGAAEAIRVYIDLNEWQIGEIKAALKEADAGDFASEEELRAVVRKWRSEAG
jgi:predicted transcriptional regulator